MGSLVGKREVRPYSLGWVSAPGEPLGSESPIGRGHEAPMFEHKLAVAISGRRQTVLMSRHQLVSTYSYEVSFGVASSMSLPPVKDVRCRECEAA